MTYKILAAAALIILSGCLDDAGNADAEQDLSQPMGPDFEPVSFAFGGEFLAGGIDPPQEFTFDVPAGATEVAALLTWSMPGAILDFQLFDPMGEEAADGWGESPYHRYVTTTRTPEPGEWTARVSIEQGVDAHFDLQVEARQGAHWGPIAVTYTVPVDDFVEINLNMVPGDGFNFTWASNNALYFNVHYHADGQTERPIEARGTSMEGNFRAPDTQVYSLLWRNEGVLPVEVEVAVDGTYRLHSMTREAPDQP